MKLGFFFGPVVQRALEKVAEISVVGKGSKGKVGEIGGEGGDLKGVNPFQARHRKWGRCPYFRFVMTSFLTEWTPGRCRGGSSRGIGIN